jgi:hypothetical protein
MARGIRKKDFWYEVDQKDNTGTLDVVTHMLVSLDQYNVTTDDAEDMVKASATLGSSLTHIKAHINLNKNKNQFGIHPRHAILEWTGTVSSAKCYGHLPKRIIEMPILTLAQFAVFVPWDFEASDQTAEQENAIIKINHSFDGTAKLTYKIRKLVHQELI